MSKRNKKSIFGFTIVELLVVVSIISLISSIVFAEFSISKKKSRDVTRMSNLLELQKAIELYRNENNNYPSTSNQFWSGTNVCGGAQVIGKGYGATGYVPGVAPTLIGSLPEDPQSSATRCYIYRSDGIDYMISAYNGMEALNPNSGPHSLDRASTNDNSIAVYSSGAAGW